jgi:hypothetical protein
MTTLRKIRKRQLSSLEKSINHYMEVIKNPTSSNLTKHYAMGALDILERVKQLADANREEMARLWHGRAQDSIMTLYQCTKGNFHDLHNLMCD